MDWTGLLTSLLTWAWIAVVVMAAIAIRNVKNMVKGGAMKGILIFNVVLALATYLAVSLGVVRDTISLNWGFPGDMLWVLVGLVLSIYAIEVVVVVLGEPIYGYLRKNVK